MEKGQKNEVGRLFNKTKNVIVCIWILITLTFLVTEQPKRNVLEPVRDGPIMKDGEVVEGPKNIFRHGVLGCCSKPDAICCAILLDAYICPCLVFGSIWKKTSGGEKCCNHFCYPCCGFFCGCLLGFFHVVPCLLICLRSNYRKEFKYFIRIQNVF